MKTTNLIKKDRRDGAEEMLQERLQKGNSWQSRKANFHSFHLSTNHGGISGIY